MRIIIEPGEEQEAEGRCRIEVEVRGDVTDDRARQLLETATTAFFYVPRRSLIVSADEPTATSPVQARSHGGTNHVERRRADLPG